MRRRALPGRFTGILRFLACACVVALAAACGPIGVGGGPSKPETGAAPAVSGEVLGNGGVRVGLLLPKSAGGNGGATAVAFRNAAALAMQDFPNAGIQIAVYDSGGAPAAAQTAVGKALSEGSQIILGPLFSAEVAAVAPQARQAGVPVVAFSSDANVAGPGVFLLSFLPSDDVERVISYSASQGRKSFAALLPNNAYGAVVEASFRRAVAGVGGRIVAIETYDADEASMQAKAKAIAGIAPQIDALLMPDSPTVAPGLAASLATGGVTRDKVRFLGSGQWDDPRVLNDPNMVGSWFPAPSKQNFEAFAAKYQAAYGSTPPRNASLAYDGAVLAAGLVSRYGAQAFENSVLGNQNGFNGLDGVFRFLPSGITQRQLAVYEVTGSGSRVVAPAGRSFAPQS